MTSRSATCGSRPARCSAPRARSAPALEHTFLLAVTLISAETIALTDKIFDVTIEYTKDRYSFGRPVASYQAVKHRLADHKTWLEAGFGLSTALARALDSEDGNVSKLASVTKAHISEQS